MFTEKIYWNLKNCVRISLTNAFYPKLLENVKFRNGANIGREYITTGLLLYFYSWRHINIYDFRSER